METMSLCKRKKILYLLPEGGGVCLVDPMDRVGRVGGQ